MRILITLLVVMWGCVVSAQQMAMPLGEAELVCNVNDLLPEDVEVNGATQGFAIYGRYGFSMHDKGQCVIIDLKRKQFVNTFVLEGNTGHCNNASFGVERYSKQSVFPMLLSAEEREPAM